jgi:hypothetical protein
MKSLRHLAQDTRVSKPSARTVTKPLKIKPCKTTVVHELQPHDGTNRVNICNWILQSVNVGEITSHLILSSDEASFHNSQQQILECILSEINT